jgi:hypothetical protein
MPKKSIYCATGALLVAFSAILGRMDGSRADTALVDRMTV